MGRDLWLCSCFCNKDRELGELIGKFGGRILRSVLSGLRGRGGLPGLRAADRERGLGAEGAGWLAGEFASSRVR